jgi:capsule polysaccharide export protein KpsC/LpsZ
LSFLINNPDSCVFLCEDGFIRSYDTWANPKSPEKLKQSCSLLVDTLGYYFDATKPTLIENMLNDKTIIISDE